MLLTEEELVETALLRYAQQAATRWGADRFAAEFERREREERWLVVARSNSLRAPDLTGLGPASPPPSPLVDASVREQVIGPGTEELRFERPKYERHPSVPRPPADAPEPERRRGRLRRRARATAASGWTITPAEAARMSPTGRRLYGIEDPADGSRR